MKHILLSLVLLLIPSVALAQEPGGVPAAPDNTPNAASAFVADFKLIQAYRSQTFGNLKLPTRWTVTDEKNHLRAVEELNDMPAALDIFLLDKLPDTSKESLISNISASIGQNLQDSKKYNQENITIEGTKVSPTFIQIEGTEEGVPRTIGLLFVMTGKKLYILAVSSPAARTLPRTHKDLLIDIFKNM